MRANCLSECRQVSRFHSNLISGKQTSVFSFAKSYLMKFCNCSVALFYPAKNYRECNISSLLCMIPHNDLVNALKPTEKNAFFDENEEGMECSCLPECSRVSYDYELSAIYDEEKVSSDQVLIDVFYEGPEMMKYRTEVTFSGMDLLVGFGGIVSLFLGFSVMSVAEIFFFATVALFWHYRRGRARMIQKIRSRIPFMH